MYTGGEVGLEEPTPSQMTRKSLTTAIHEWNQLLSNNEQTSSHMGDTVNGVTWQYAYDQLTERTEQTYQQLTHNQLHGNIKESPSPPTS